MNKTAARRNGNGNTPPHNDEAERSLLGAAMLSTQALEVLVTETSPDDFYGWANRQICEVLVTLHRSGLDKLDPLIVADELGPILLESVGGVAELMSMQTDVPAISNARKYANIIVEAATLRGLVTVADEIKGMVADGVDGHTALDFARERIGTVDMPIGTGEPSENIEQFMARKTEYDWIVPGLLERSDRTMLTAGEGQGKSTLLRQMAVSIAAGMHPFEYHPFEMSNGELPTVMVCDVENSEPQIRRKLQPILEIEGVRRRLHPDRLRLEVRPEGIDLTQRHDARWLQERVATNRPDVLVIGPVYKLYDGDPNKEEFVRRVIRILDLVRVRYGCALLIEAHSPHGEGGHNRDLRPLGSSMWRRWPEFGYGLAPDREDEHSVWFRPWRGSRDEREWPGRLVRSNPWPWGTGHDRGRPVHRDDGHWVREEEDGEVGW